MGLCSVKMSSVTYSATVRTIVLVVTADRDIERIGLIYGLLSGFSLLDFCLFVFTCLLVEQLLLFWKRLAQEKGKGKWVGKWVGGSEQQTCKFSIITVTLFFLFFVCLPSA